MLKLSTGEILQARTELEQTLPGTAILQSRTTVADGQGGYTQTFAAASTVVCRLSPTEMQGSEGELAGRVAEVSSWMLTLPAETAIDETYRVQYSGGATFEVVEVMTRTPWELSRRVRLMEVD